MTREELLKITAAHRLWLNSGGKEGQRAELQDASLDETLDLSEADLRNGIFNGANFARSNLTDTNFQGAELRRANFSEASLRRTNLREADLQNADLQNASFLLTSQLAGANVAGAKLPTAIAEFDGLKTIAEATSNAQKLLVAMLGGCLYSWLTIGTTKDAALLTDSASSPLPVISAAIPIVGFYIIAPLILLALYFYFHLNLQRLWEALADLPAILPDGRSLDKRADPWLLNGLVTAHFVRLKGTRPALSRLQELLSISLVWWVVPATLFVFWGRFLVRHDWLGTGLHIGLITAAIGFGWMSYRLARATLRGVPREPFLWARARKDRRTFKRAAGFLGTFAIGVVFYFVSWGAIEGVPRDWSEDSYIPEQGRNERNRSKQDLPNFLQKDVPRILQCIGFNSFAKLEGQDISTKPPNWTGDPKQYPLVKGAQLRNAKLQYAEAYEVFLVNADLRNANLHGAVLASAYLNNADLSGADLTGADLSEARGLTKSQLHEAITDEKTRITPDFIRYEGP